MGSLFGALRQSRMIMRLENMLYKVGIKHLVTSLLHLQIIHHESAQQIHLILPTIIGIEYLENILTRFSIIFYGLVLKYLC